MEDLTGRQVKIGDWIFFHVRYSYEPFYRFAYVTSIEEDYVITIDIDISDKYRLLGEGEQYYPFLIIDNIPQEVKDLITA